MRLVILVLAAVVCAIDAMPFQPQVHFAMPPPPANNMNMQAFVRPSNLMPGAGMRMLSSSYKPAVSPAPAPIAHYPSQPGYGYYPPHPGHLNINNHNNNDNFNHNSEDSMGRVHDESKNANLQNQELNDILAAYSLQSFLQNTRPISHPVPSYHREQPKLKEKYTSTTGSHHASTGSYQASTGSHHGSTGSHHGSVHHEKKDVKKTHKDKNYGIPKQVKTDYTPKKHANY